MIINEEGTYTLRYTATDDCGKTTEVERELVVADTSPRRTVLYTDGTLIINEKQTDEAHNIELHGAATNVYDPMLEDGSNYAFRAKNNRLWQGEYRQIKSVLIGSKIKPISLAYWFTECYFLVSADLTNLDTSQVAVMHNFLSDCYRLENLVGLDGFDTSNTTNFNVMFYNCQALQEIDVSSFDTSNATYMQNLFYGCNVLRTIFASNLFDVSNVVQDAGMFGMCSNLVGGAGTTWSSSNTGKTYAHIDGGTSNPGYFTAKS